MTEIIEPKMMNSELKEKFRQLFNEFINTYLDTQKGEKHLQKSIQARKTAHENYKHIKGMYSKGENITDLVLLKFLPYASTEHNINKGAWGHPAPAIKKDIKQWFEGIGWASKEDWPEISKAVFSFVSNCVDNPNNIATECKYFLENPITKGMQAGFLSPILNALDPDHFILINKKPALLINYLAGTSYSTHLKDYPDFNRIGLKLINEMEDTISTPDKYDLHLSDWFDTFSHWLKADKKFWKSPPEDESKINYWQIAPADGARLWDELKDQSIAAVGYSNLDFDLAGKSEEQVLGLLKKYYPDFKKRQIQLKFRMLWQFLNLKPGDKIVANKGKSLLLGLGIVKDGYKFRPDRKEYKHTLDVDYYTISKEGNPIPVNLKGKFGKTITPLNKNEFETIETLFKSGIVEIEKVHSLNQILYGPPGTGKTYQTINYALAIIENKTIDQINSEELLYGREKLLERYKQYKSDEQVEFITFHQNYAYEDFIQGLRPSVELHSETLSFELKDGVFKKITDRALNNYQSSRHRSSGLVKKPSFKKVFEGYFKDFFEGNKENVKIKMKKVSFTITDITGRTIYFTKASGGTSHTLSIKTLSDMYEKEEYFLSSGSLRSYYKPLLKELLDYAQSIPVESEEELKNYVIIIDEINRANISRVFGELITLIESDKRYEQSNEMSTTLPSGDPFVVPPNLYIVGTMNTADKSIALIDIALRRRFEFAKVYPRVDLVVDEHKGLFTGINQEIVKEKGPDFQIGHSYFMKESDQEFKIKDVMNSKLIPLLYEYFMNDGEAVNKILSKVGINTVKNLGLYEFESYTNGKEG